MGDTIGLADILQIIWRRLWLILLGTLAIMGAVMLLTMNMQPVYRAKVTMKVKQPANVPLAYSSITTGENLAVTYSHLLRTRPLLVTAINNLGLDTSPDALRERLGTNLIAETPLLELTVEDTDPQRAADIANEVALSFIAMNNEQDRLAEMTAYEQGIVAQLAELKALIERNQTLLTAPTIPYETVPQPDTTSLQSVLASQQSTYASLLAIYLEIQMTQAQFYDVEVVDPAAPPVAPIRPQVPLYTFVGALLGLTVSAGGVFLIELLDRSLKSTDELARALARPTLGVIPRLQGTERSAAPIPWTAPHSAVSEAFRALRTNIRFAGVDRPLNAVLVTSAEPGAGKTTVALNLAVVCAQAGLRVVLMDTDLRLPRLHAAFRLGNAPGLTNLLLGNVQDAEAYLQTTGIDNLRLLASGPLPPNPAELLGSQKMDEILRIVRGCADLVILDAPPALVVTDAAVLSPKVDGALLVARMHRTQRDAVRQAAVSLLQAGGTVLGGVLNAVPKPRGSYYDYYRMGKGRRKVSDQSGMAALLARLRAEHN